MQKKINFQPDSALKAILLLSVLLQICLYTNAQSYTGYSSAAYNGIYAVVNSPADILNHRFKGDLNLAGVSAGISNNIIKFKYKNRKDDYGGTSWANPITKNGKAYFNADVFGPSFLIRLSDKNAFAITTRGRVMTNLHGVSKYILNTVLQDTIDEALLKNNLAISNITANTHAWTEMAFTYSRQVAISDYGVWKAGISLKYLSGVAAELFSTDQLSFTHDSVFDAARRRNKDALLNTQGTINLQYTKNLDTLQSDFFSFKNPGFGIDVGVSYEFRDEMQVYETLYSDKTANYIWKVGASITDIGYIHYGASQTNGIVARGAGNTYLMDTLAVPADSSNIGQMNNYYQKLFNAQSGASAFNMQLPTTLHLSYDRFFNKVVGINAQLNIPLVFSSLNKYSGTYNPFSVVVTPRAEITWAGFYMPISYNSVSGMQVGAALRVGPLVIGSSSFIKARMGKTKAADLYFILRIPFFGYKEFKNKPFLDSLPKLSRKQKRALGCPNN